MADTVTSITEFAGFRRVIIRLTNKSDGTGESAVTKVTKSNYTNSKGVVPTALNVESLQWSIQGFQSVELFWDHTTPDAIAKLSGNGFKDFSQGGVLPDPRSAGGTGNITLTTNAAIVGATYDIVMSLILSD